MRAEGAELAVNLLPVVTSAPQIKLIYRMYTRIQPEYSTLNCIIDLRFRRAIRLVR